MKELYKGCVGNIVSGRSAAAKEFEKKLVKLSAEEKEITDSLLEGLPKVLQEWLVEECVFSTIFEYGKYSSKIRFDAKGFGSLQSVKDAVKSLNRKWKDVIKIELGPQTEPHRAEVLFTAVL